MYKLEFSSTSPKAVIATGLKNGKYGYKLNPNYEKELIKMKKAGIKKIEFGRFDARFADYTIKIMKKALRLVKKHKFIINTVHFPYSGDWVDLACPWPNDRKEIVKWFIKLFKIFDKFNPKAYIFHPGGGSATLETRERFMGYLIESANELASATKVPICIENMVGKNMTNGIEQIKDFADRCPNAYVVVDVNHFIKDKPEDAILVLGDRIKALHISDHDFVTERHMMPGDGLIDWNKVIGALEQIGFSGAFNYELRMNKFGYTYKQVVENYEKLFEEYNKSKKD